MIFGVAGGVVKKAVGSIGGVGESGGVALERSIANGAVVVANTTKFSAGEKLFLNAPRLSETKLDEMDNRTLYCVVVAPGINSDNPYS